MWKNDSPVRFVLLIGFVMISVFIFGGEVENSPYQISKARVFLSGPETIHRLRWAFQAGGSIKSSPVIYDERLYIGCDDGCLYCLNPGNGELIWKSRTGGEISSTPAVLSNRVFFLSGDSNLYALDAKTGNLIWIFKTGSVNPEINYDYFYKYLYVSSPVVYSGRVYFGSPDGSLYCLKEDSGKMSWRYSTVHKRINALFGIFCTPVIANDMVYFGNSYGTFYALNSKNGKQVWTFDTYSLIYTTPVIVGDNIVFGGMDWRIHSLDAITGNQIWEFKMIRGWVTSSPVLFDGVLYLSFADPKEFAALNADNGKIIWERPLYFEYIFSSPVISGNLVYFGTSEASSETPGSGKLYALERKSGKIKFSFSADGQIISSPFIDKGVIYFGTTRGTVYALE